MEELSPHLRSSVSQSLVLEIQTTHIRTNSMKDILTMASEMAFRCAQGAWGMTPMNKSLIIKQPVSPKAETVTFISKSLSETIAQRKLV